MDVKPEYYEYIVVGLGGIGSGALYWLSKRAGKSVLGLEQFKLGHYNGSSEDRSRIIRLIYRDENYTKLALDAFKTWDEVEKDSGIKVYWKTGGVDIASKQSAKAQRLNRFAEAMSKQNVPYEWWTGSELRRRFPQFNTDDSHIAIYQKDGGLVDPSLANSVQIQLARGNGARVMEQCPVLRLQPTSDGHTLVFTAHGTFKCRRLVVTAGAWINHVLGSVDVRIPITVTQEQVTYMATPHMKQFTKDKFPICIHHDDHYGCGVFPINGNSGVKVMIESQGSEVTPDTRTFTPCPVREKACVDHAAKLVPQAVGPVMYTKTCLYTNTRDNDFVIDDLSFKDMPQIVVCGCGSGHAYKFASLLGKITSEMAIDGRTKYNISAFSITRKAVQDPN